MRRKRGGGEDRDRSPHGAAGGAKFLLQPWLAARWRAPVGPAPGGLCRPPAAGSLEGGTLRRCGCSGLCEKGTMPAEPHATNRWQSSRQLAACKGIPPGRCSTAGTARARRLRWRRAPPTGRWLPGGAHLGEYWRLVSDQVAGASHAGKAKRRDFFPYGSHSGPVLCKRSFAPPSAEECGRPLRETADPLRRSVESALFFAAAAWEED